MLFMMFFEVYSKTLLDNRMIRSKPLISDFSLGHSVTVTLKNKGFKPSVAHKYSKYWLLAPPQAK